MPSNSRQGMVKKLWPLTIYALIGVVMGVILNCIGSTLVWVAWFLVMLNVLSIIILYSIIDSAFVRKRENE